MIKKLTILGCGSSLGSPWLNNYWGNCNYKDKKNIRTRCCIHIQFGPISILIDTSPDIKYQMLKNRIRKVDAILYTHEHIDQTGGIFEFRPIYFKTNTVIPIYCNKGTKQRLINTYPWLFKNTKIYPRIMKFKSTNKNIKIKKGVSNFSISSIKVQHGNVDTRGYIFNKIAYIPDCKYISEKNFKMLKNLDYLIIDCFRPIKKTYTHLNYEESIDLIKNLSPKKAILTNMHVDLDYKRLKESLPKNIVPAYDNLRINF